MVSPLAWLGPGRDDLTDNALVEMCSLACRLEAWAGSVRARAALNLRRSYQAELKRRLTELAAVPPRRSSQDTFMTRWVCGRSDVTISPPEWLGSNGFR